MELQLLMQTSSLSGLLALLLALLLTLLLTLRLVGPRKLRREPPGPTPLPLVGNLLQLDLKRLYRTFGELSQRYGSVFTVYMGTKRIVVLAGYSTVREALTTFDEEFGERDPAPIVQDLSRGHGVLWSNGESWKEMRRFSLMNLRDFGMGKRASEEKVMEECQHLIGLWKDLKGEAFDPSKSVNYAASNIICSIIYGKRFDYEDVEFVRLVDRTTRRIQLLGSPYIRMYNMYPSLFGWVADRKEYHQLVSANKQQNVSVLKGLKESLEPLACRGLVDAFLVRKHKLEEGGATDSPFHEENLLTTVMNLFGAGTETTGTTLRWALLYMAKYPEIQDRVREELARVLEGRQVRLEDRKELPLTNAVIHETQRLAAISSLSLPHRATRDFMFKGFFIKKGTTVYPFLRSVLHDATQWEEPHSFHPAHFLDRDGKFVKRSAFMPFGAGRRACLGEGLARAELFIFLATLLQNFRFTPPPGVSEDELDVTPRVGFTINPSSHRLCAVPCL